MALAAVRLIQLEPDHNLNEQIAGGFTVQDTGSVDGDGFGVRAEANGRFGGLPCSERQTNDVCAGTRGQGGALCQDVECEHHD
jgi:hypothetical protein